MGLYDHYQTAIIFANPSLKYAYISLKQSYKTPVKKDLRRIILFKIYERFKLYIILCIFCFLIIFYIYQTIHFFPNKFKSLRSKFHKCFKYNSEDKAVWNIFFDSYFDCYCVHVALSNSTYSISIINRINRSH